MFQIQKTGMQSGIALVHNVFNLMLLVPLLPRSAILNLVMASLLLTF